jgi:hypothetical protein
MAILSKHRNRKISLMGTARKQARIPNRFVVARWLRNPERGFTTRMWLRLRERCKRHGERPVRWKVSCSKLTLVHAAGSMRILTTTQETQGLSSVDKCHQKQRQGQRIAVDRCVEADESDVNPRRSVWWVGDIMSFTTPNTIESSPSAQFYILTTPQPHGLMRCCFRGIYLDLCARFSQKGVAIYVDLALWWATKEQLMAGCAE